MYEKVHQFFTAEENCINRNLKDIAAGSPLLLFISLCMSSEMQTSFIPALPGYALFKD